MLHVGVPAQTRSSQIVRSKLATFALTQLGKTVVSTSFAVFGVSSRSPSAQAAPATPRASSTPARTMLAPRDLTEPFMGIIPRPGVPRHMGFPRHRGADGPAGGRQVGQV